MDNNINIQTKRIDIYIYIWVIPRKVTPELIKNPIKTINKFLSFKLFFFFIVKNSFLFFLYYDYLCYLILFIKENKFNNNICWLINREQCFLYLFLFEIHTVRKPLQIRLFIKKFIIIFFSCNQVYNMRHSLLILKKLS